jgi:hypothetical protein
MLARLNLLECVELRAGPGRRAAFLRKLGISEQRFNALVGGRVDPTDAEKKALLESIPETEHNLFRFGPTAGRGGREVAMKQ